MNWLKQRREELELSQQDLAYFLEQEGYHISRSAISSWETGRYNPHIENPQFRERLAKVLELDVTELLRRAGFEVFVGRHTKDGERAAHLIDRLPQAKREIALKLLEVLVDEDEE